MAGALHIGQVDSVTLDLECGSCQAKFRITPSEATVRARVIDCMRCGQPLEVPAYDAGRGWKRVAPGSVFHRFRSELPAPLLDSEALDAPAATPKRRTAPTPETTPEQREQREQREPQSAAHRPRQKFAFETFVPGEPEPPRREVDARVAPRELAPESSARDEDLEVLLGKARALKRSRGQDEDVESASGAPVIEDVSRPTEPLSKETIESITSKDAIDVAFEPPLEPQSLEESAVVHETSEPEPFLVEGASSAENEDREKEPDALRPPEFLPTFEPEPEHFELQLGEQVIGPLDVISVQALLAGGLHGVARVRVVGEDGWRSLEDHEVFGIFFDAIEGELEDEPEDAILLEDEVEGAFFHTLPMASLAANIELPPPMAEGLSSPSEVLRAPPLPADARSEVLEDTSSDDEVEDKQEAEDVAARPSVTPSRTQEGSTEILLDEDLFDIGDEPETKQAPALPSAATESDLPATPPRADAEELTGEDIAAPAREDIPEPRPDNATSNSEDVSAPEPVTEPLSAPPTIRQPLGWGARILLGVFVLLLVVGAFVAGDQLKPFSKNLEQRATATANEVRRMISLEPEVASAQAVSTASTMVRLAAQQNWQSRERQREVAASMLEEGDARGASNVLKHLWLVEPRRSPSLAMLYARALLAANEYKLAREVAIDGRMLSPEFPGFEQVFLDAVKGDPALHPEVRTIIPDKEIDEIRALGGGKSVSFKLRQKGENLYAFKPAQVEWGEGWRSEVAAYLMCEAITCNFEVPKSLPARISRQDFEELYGRHTSPKQNAYKERFGELTWVVKKGPDGEEREYLHGVVKEWVPGFVEWPIEYVDTWASLVDSGQKLSNLDRSFNAAFTSLRLKQQRKYWYPISKEREGATTREVASGLSSLTLFDFLTNNWDRYSQVEAYYGVNNHFKDGRFLSLDNGAAFHLQPMLVVKQRFNLISRFSKRFVVGVRMMQPEQFDPIFFPSKSQEARTRLDVFWDQREKALARIDELARERGEDAVLCFE